MRDLDLSGLDPSADRSDKRAAAGRREEVRIPLPKGFDPATHQGFLLQKLSERRGNGWKLDLIDMRENMAVASRTLTLTQVEAVTKTTKMVTLQTNVKPSDGDRLAAQFAEQFPGFQMTEFEPHIGRARLTKMSASEAHARAAVAEIMRVKPWQVTVSARVGGGFNMGLPPSYLPSKHDEKLDEVAATVIGEPGWYAQLRRPHPQGRPGPRSVANVPANGAAPNGQGDQVSSADPLGPNHG